MKDFINLLDVHVACNIRDTLNLAKAAEKISVPRATLVASLLRLEKRLGKRLFDRRQGSGVVTLTEHGKFALPLFEQLLWIHKNIMNESDATLLKHNEGEVGVTSIQTLLEGFIIPYIKPFLETNPKVRLHVHQKDDVDDMRQAMHEIYIGTWLGETDKYTYFPFHTFQQKLWASSSYIEKNGIPKTPEDLIHHTLLMQRNVGEKDILAGNNRIARMFADRANELSTLSVAGPRATDCMAEAGLGIMIAAKETVKLSKLSLQEVLPEFEGDKIEIFVRVNKEFLKTPLAQFLVDWIFICRDLSLKDISVKPSEPYTPFLKAPKQSLPGAL